MEYGAKALISKPNFKRSFISNDNLVSIELYKTSILMEKPAIVDVSILEISKLKMYDIYYNIMKSNFENNLKLLYTDTDSFIYSIINSDFYEFIKSKPEQFETSDFASNNIFNIEKHNKKVPGLMKDEYMAK